jgi:hypothetical protein
VDHALHVRFEHCAKGRQVGDVFGQRALRDTGVRYDDVRRTEAANEIRGRAASARCIATNAVGDATAAADCESVELSEARRANAPTVAPCAASSAASAAPMPLLAPVTNTFTRDAATRRLRAASRRRALPIEHCRNA